MPDRDTAFDAMAADLGILRYRGEKDADFCHRVAYSAARPWISAYCIDDGSEGKAGLTKQGINRRMKTWVATLEDVRPGMRAWFKSDENGLPYIYNRLIDLGDIVPNGFTGNYLAHKPSVMPVCDEFSIIVGFVDTTAKPAKACGIDLRETVTSGLTTVVRHDVSCPEYQPSWWTTDLDYMPWERASSYGELEYANLRCKSGRWSLRHSESWRDEPVPVEGLSLARPAKAPMGEIQYYACRHVGHSMYLSRINWLMAQELFFYMRMRHGNSARAAWQQLDDKHVRLAIPTSIIPGQYSRILGSILWPVDDVTAGGTCVARAEVMPIVRDLLYRSYFSLKEVKK